MKIHYLAVIFIIIIMPIMIVFSEYMNNQITIINTEKSYERKLRDSTYDSIKAFQLNTINTALYVPESRVKNIEAAVETFFNSLKTGFQHMGSRSKTMNAYVPALVFTMYDGYYIYSPYRNTVTNVTDELEEDYEDNEIRSGLKPFIAYTCKYIYNHKTYIITYSMENYILVDIFDSANKHSRKEGYLISGIEKVNDNKYIYNGIDFNKGDEEILSEYLYIDKDNKGEYYYGTINGTKYYYEGSGGYNKNTHTINEPAATDKIFYIDNTGNKHYQFTNYENNQDRFKIYFKRIFHNNTAFEYYKDAYEFTEWVNQNLNGLSDTNIENKNTTFKGYNFVSTGNIFEGTEKNYSGTMNIQDSDSNFNRHRKDIIRATISTNLETAITGFSQYSAAGEEFLMPKITEDDWELLENDICIATFMQGIRVGGKVFNSYSVIPNNFNKEYADENDIYILKKDHTYTRVNDKTLNSGNIMPKNTILYQPGVLKINFEPRRFAEDVPFNPVSYLSGTRYEPYLASYTGAVGSDDITSLDTIDMYKYMRTVSDTVKRAYYTALGRERYSSFKYTNNDV